MDLLIDPWIPVRDQGGMGKFKLLTLEELLCADRDWWVSIPRDDLEMACIQLLVCMVQTMFMPEKDSELRERLRQPLSERAFAKGTKPCRDWFDLDHPTQPFMQSRRVKAENITPIQKLFIGLPEGNNHAFFNDVGEIRKVSGSAVAIALFNQASNCPSFGGGFKGSLRGSAPITALVKGRNLRETVWRNVVTLARMQERLPGYEYDLAEDTPTWVDPIRKKQAIYAHQIGMARGLFWQPAQVELSKTELGGECDLLGTHSKILYCSFKKEKFDFNVKDIWAHPHGSMMAEKKKGTVEWKFASFTTTAPAWTRLSEIVVPSPLTKDSTEGAAPAAPIAQTSEVYCGEPLHLLIGGYRIKQASVLERRHELCSLAEGWENDGKGRVKKLVEAGMAAKKALRGKLWYAAQGDKEKGMKGIGVALHQDGEKRFYLETEELFHSTLQDGLTFKEWQQAQASFSQRIATICRRIYKDLTDPYTRNPELIPVIAWSRRSLEKDLRTLSEGAEPDHEKES